jgi:flagellar motor switch protein FliM
MTAQDTASVIHRKARAARDGSDGRAMSPAKALRLSLARAADTLFDLALTVATVEQRRLNLAQVIDTMQDEGLILLLDGAGGARGAVALDAQMMAALIEVQTTGTLRPGAAPARRATRTDAAMVAPLVDALLDGIDAEMTAGVEGHVPRGFRFGDRMEDLRALGLALDAPEFDLYRVTADLGPGARTGRLDLLMPARRAVPPNARRARRDGRCRTGRAGGARRGDGADQPAAARRLRAESRAGAAAHPRKSGRDPIDRGGGASCGRGAVGAAQRLARPASGVLRRRALARDVRRAGPP